MISSTSKYVLIFLGFALQLDEALATTILPNVRPLKCDRLERALRALLSYQGRVRLSCGTTTKQTVLRTWAR